MSPSDTMPDRGLHPAAIRHLRHALDGIAVGPAAEAALAPVLTHGQAPGSLSARATATPIHVLREQHVARIEELLRASDDRALLRYLARAILDTPRNAEVLPTACPADSTLIEFALPFALPGALEAHGGTVMSCFSVRGWHKGASGIPVDTTLLVPTAGSPMTFRLPSRMGLDLIGITGLRNPTDPRRTKALAAIDGIAAKPPAPRRDPSSFSGWFTCGEEAV